MITSWLQIETVPQQDISLNWRSGAGLWRARYSRGFPIPGQQSRTGLWTVANTCTGILNQVGVIDHLIQWVSVFPHLFRAHLVLAKDHSLSLDERRVATCLRSDGALLQVNEPDFTEAEPARTMRAPVRGEPLNAKSPLGFFRDAMPDASSSAPTTM